MTNPEELASTSIEQAMSNATKTTSKISLFQRQTNVIDPYAKNSLKRLLATLLRCHFFSASRETRLQIEEFPTKLTWKSALPWTHLRSEKKGEVSPLTQENNVFFQWTVISLVFTNMFTHQ